jgi:hypothetical protein
MQLPHSHNISACLSPAAGTWSENRIACAVESPVPDVKVCNYDTVGHCYRDRTPVSRSVQTVTQPPRGQLGRFGRLRSAELLVGIILHQPGATQGRRTAECVATAQSQNPLINFLSVTFRVSHRNPQSCPATADVTHKVTIMAEPSITNRSAGSAK